MSNESISILKTSIEQRKIKSKQLSALQKKENDENEKVAKLNESLAQAERSHEACMLSNLVGNASDSELKESKNNLKGLVDSLQETKEVLELIRDARFKLNLEIEHLSGDITVHRGICCLQLAKESHDDMAANKKINEKLVTGYGAFISSGEYDRSWTAYLLCNFPHPSERDMQLAVEKLKKSNDFMCD